MKQWVLSAMLCALLTLPAMAQRGGGGHGAVVGGGHGFAGGGHGFAGGGMAARPSGGYGYRGPAGYGHMPYAGGYRPGWGGNNWHGNNWNGGSWNGNNWGWHNNGWHGNGWGWNGNGWRGNGWGWRGHGWWWPGWGWGWGNWWWPSWSWGWGGWWWPGSSWGWGGGWDNAAYYPSDIYGASNYQASNYQAQNYSTGSYVTPEYSPGYSSYPPDTRTQDEIESLRSEVDQLRAQQEAQSAAASNPQIHAETVLIYKDGHTEQVRDYAIIGKTLWIFNESRARKVALADLDIPATKRDNEDRGMTFIVPSSR